MAAGRKARLRFLKVGGLRNYGTANFFVDYKSKHSLSLDEYGQNEGAYS